MLSNKIKYSILISAMPSAVQCVVTLNYNEYFATNNNSKGNQILFQYFNS